MKNKEFHKLLKKNKSKSESGFTLTELLVGLFMSIFVVGALGWGLMQMLRTTRTETSKVEVRGETSRALDFISDEVKRARTIEANAASAGNFDPNDSDGNAKTVVLALDIPLISEGDTFDTDNNDSTTDERVVYYLKSNGNDNWQGPQVLYRWGPPLDANGDYTANSGWQDEALIDGIDDTAITGNPCNAGETLTPALTTATGFHACINAGNTAQLYLTGETKTAGGTDTYTANTRVVARARTASAGTTSTFAAYTMSYRSLGAVYNCNPSNDSTWSMRSVFDVGSNQKSWIHQDGKQPQPIQIDTSTDNSLEITTIPVRPVDSAGNPFTWTSGVDNCLSKGSEAAEGTEPLSDYADATQFPEYHSVPHTMNFNKADTDYWHSFNGNDSSGHDEPDVKGDGTILILKEGSTLKPSDYPYLNLGYDFNGDGTEEQKSLGKFLFDEGYAVYDNGSDATGGYKITNLNPDERIMAVEVGHTDTNQPGFDVQDSIVLLSSDIFAQEHSN